MKKLNLYLISQDINNGYDTYDSIIVCAENEEEAKMIKPNGELLEDDDYSWVNLSQINKLKIEFLGVANKGIEKGIILASFHAG